MYTMSRSDYAYKEIKDWLISGNLKPGEVISSYKIAEALKLSRTPVVNALKKLEHEGYIEIIPQVGCKVRLPDVNEARESFLIRAVLEGFAAELATQNRTTGDMEQLKEIYQKSISAAQRDNPKEYAMYNKELHLKIVQMAHMKTLMDLLQGFWENVSFQAASADFLLERHDVSIKEHGEILTAMQNGKAMEARKLLEEHLRKCTNDFCNSIEKLALINNSEEAKAISTL